MQKIVNGIAIASGVISLTVVGGDVLPDVTGPAGPMPEGVGLGVPSF